MLISYDLVSAENFGNNGIITGGAEGVSVNDTDISLLSDDILGLNRHSWVTTTLMSKDAGIP